MKKSTLGIPLQRAWDGASRAEGALAKNTSELQTESLSASMGADLRALGGMAL